MTSGKSMRAIQQAVDGSLSWTAVEKPSIKADEVLVAIHATALNRADLLQRRGLYPPPPGASPILGLECAGLIAQCGSAVHDWKVGDRVCALLPGGGYAEYAAVPAAMVIRPPAEASWPEAAAFPEAFSTAYLNLVVEAALREGETCYIAAGASGVGLAAIQLARCRGAVVYASAGTEAKLQLCREMGASLAVNYKELDVFEAIRRANAGRGLDLVLDMIGASNLSANLNLLEPRGRLLLIGLLGGRRAEIDLGLLLRKNLRLIATTLRDRSLAEKSALTSAIRQELLPLWHSGSIRTVVDSLYPIQEVEAAHRRMADNANCGKIVLQIES